MFRMSLSPRVLYAVVGAMALGALSATSIMLLRREAPPPLVPCMLPEGETRAATRELLEQSICLAPFTNCPKRVQHKPLKLVHITKTGGSLLETVAREVGITWGLHHERYEDSAVLGKKKRKTAWWHDEFRTKPRELRAQYDWFTVVRNPYSRAISEFHCVWGGYGANNLTDWSADQFNRNLQRRIHQRAHDKNLWSDHHYIEQHLYLTPDVRMWVLRFEHLSDDFALLMDQYNLTLRLNSTPVNANSHVFTKANLSIQTMGLIQDTYLFDFAMFNYSMDLDECTFKC
eukprot:TRINITY_DN15875_c0_g1_i2.p1 TRINITY_DN15875_c0_g1~~TRINITY_DN15875_c0_g1_i2.p1  ORF type:complete len:288 (+),score=52.76 TRINITY_DN15875_c0_g1_i2:218-1081(+)